MKLILAMLALVAFTCSGTVIAAEKNAKAASASKWANQGKVLEVNDTSMYTYLQVTGAKGPVWIAASHIAGLAKGDTVGYGDGSVMTNFHSKAMNRTFESIIFTDKVEKLK